MFQLVAEALWQGTGGWHEEERDAAKSAFAALTLAIYKQSELRELCAEVRWSAVSIHATRNISLARAILARPHIAARVRKFSVLITTNTDDGALDLGRADVDALKALIGRLDHLEGFSMQLLEEGDDGADVSVLTDAFRRLVDVFALVPRPRLTFLHLYGRWCHDDNPTEISASALRAVLESSPHLVSLDLCVLSITDAIVGPAASADGGGPALVIFGLYGVQCSDDLANELARCLGSHTISINVANSPRDVQRILIRGGGSQGGLAARSHRLRWHVGGAEELDAAEVREWTRRCLSTMPAFEVIHSSIRRNGSLALIHAADATSRHFPCALPHITARTVTRRLADPTYGRNLARIGVHALGRARRLEEICQRRGIAIDYYPVCVGPERTR